MTFLVMANKHILATTDDLEDARSRMKHFKKIMEGFGLGGTATFYILETIEKQTNPLP